MVEQVKLIWMVHKIRLRESMVLRDITLPAKQKR